MKGSGAMKTKEEIIERFLDENGEVFVRLTDDFLFKEIFGRQTNKKYLADFLESLFEYERGSLQGKLKSGLEVSLEKQEYLAKGGRCDLIAIFDSTVVNVEMYRAFSSESLEKSSFYVMTITASRILRGMEHTPDKRIVQFNIVEQDNYGIEEEHEKINNTEVFYILIDKRLNSLYDKDNLLNKYLKIFIAESYQEREEIAKGDEILMEFVKSVREYCNGKQFKKYFSHEYWNRRIYKHEGRQEGLEEGKKLGINEGKALGIQKRNIEIAKSMLKDGVNINTIQKYTSLSIEEISKLKEE